MGRDPTSQICKSNPNALRGWGGGNSIDPIEIPRLDRAETFLKKEKATAAPLRPNPRLICMKFA